MPYVATINVPGYLPMDDEPPVFETPAEAWEHLEAERNLDLAENCEDGGPSWDRPMEDMGRLGRLGLTGDVHGFTPGYDGAHDPGLAYSVTEVSS